MCVDKGENFVYTGGGDNSVRRWNLSDGVENDKMEDTKSLDLQVSMSLLFTFICLKTKVSCYLV